MTVGPEFLRLKGPDGLAGFSEPVPPRVYSLGEVAGDPVADAARMADLGAVSGDLAMTDSGELFFIDWAAGGEPVLRVIGELVGPAGPDGTNTYVDPGHVDTDHVTRPIRFAPGNYQALADGLVLSNDMVEYPRDL